MYMYVCMYVLYRPTHRIFLNHPIQLPGGSFLFNLSEFRPAGSHGDPS